MQAIAYPVRRRTPRGGFVAEGRVRSLPVVILDPGSDLDPCIGHAEEQGLNQQPVGDPAVKALDVADLYRPFGKLRRALPGAM